MTTVAGLETQVSGALHRAGYSGNGTALVVAVSGGPDSSALLHCLSRLRERHMLRLHVAHLNHDFRGEEAEEDARFVSALAQDLGLAATVERGDVPAYQQQRRISSFEQAARELRYAFLVRVAESAGAAAVAVGHTADDLAETVLLHILRGAGIHGLRGMSEISSWPWPQAGGQLRLFRPLLQVTKDDTLSYCRGLGRDYREDSGNYLPQFTRNRVRHRLLPLLASEYNPRVRESLVRLARTAALELDYLEGETSRLWPRVAVAEDGAVGFDQPALASQHPALQKLLLRRAYAHLMGDTRRLEERHLDAMAALAQEGVTGRSLDLPGGLKLHRSYDYLRLSREAGLPCPFPGLEGIHPLPLPSAGESQVVSIAGPWRVTLRVDKSPQPSFESKTPESKTPESKTPESKTPEGKTPEGKTPEGKTPEGKARPLRSGSGPVAPGRQAWTAYLDRLVLGVQGHVRTRQPGDRFQPLGMAGEKKLQDFFTDARVPRDWRDQVPLLVSHQGIAWVVGYRIAHWARVGASESGPSEILQVTFELEE